MATFGFFLPPHNRISVVFRCERGIKKIVSKYHSLHSAIFRCFLDDSKVFDRVNHGKLFHKLSLSTMLHYLIRILLYWYTNQIMTMMVRWGDAMYDPFHVSNGVRQGGI